jgi:hypothetical protein
MLSPRKMLMSFSHVQTPYMKRLRTTAPAHCRTTMPSCQVPSLALKDALRLEKSHDDKLSIFFLPSFFCFHLLPSCPVHHLNTSYPKSEHVSKT